MVLLYWHGLELGPLSLRVYEMKCRTRYEEQVLRYEMKCNRSMGMKGTKCLSDCGGMVLVPVRVKVTVEDRMTSIPLDAKLDREAEDSVGMRREEGQLLEGEARLVCQITTWKDRSTKESENTDAIILEEDVQPVDFPRNFRGGFINGALTIARRSVSHAIGARIGEDRPVSLVAD